MLVNETRKCQVKLGDHTANLLVTKTKYRYDVVYKDGPFIGFIKSTPYGFAWSVRATALRRKPLKGKARTAEEAFERLCWAALVVPVGQAGHELLTQMGRALGMDKSVFDPLSSWFAGIITPKSYHAVLKAFQHAKVTHIDASAYGSPDKWSTANFLSEEVCDVPA